MLLVSFYLTIVILQTPFLALLHLLQLSLDLSNVHDGLLPLLFSPLLHALLPLPHLLLQLVLVKVLLHGDKRKISTIYYVGIFQRLERTEYIELTSSTFSSSFSSLTFFFSDKGSTLSFSLLLDLDDNNKGQRGFGYKSC